MRTKKPAEGRCTRETDFDTGVDDFVPRFQKHEGSLHPEFRKVLVRRAPEHFRKGSMQVISRQACFSGYCFQGNLFVVAAMDVLSRDLQPPEQFFSRGSFGCRHA